MSVFISSELLIYYANVPQCELGPITESKKLSFGQVKEDEAQQHKKHVKNAEKTFIKLDLCVQSE